MYTENIGRGMKWYTVHRSMCLSALVDALDCNMKWQCQGSPVYSISVQRSYSELNILNEISMKQSLQIDHRLRSIEWKHFLGLVDRPDATTMYSSISRILRINSSLLRISFCKLVSVFWFHFAYQFNISILSLVSLLSESMFAMITIRFYFDSRRNSQNHSSSSRHSKGRHSLGIDWVENFESTEPKAIINAASRPYSSRANLSFIAI